MQLIVGEGHHQDAVRGGHTDGHDRAHQARHVERRLREEQAPHNSGESAGQRHQNDEGIGPALEVHHHQEINQQRTEDQPKAHAHERCVHAVHLPSHHDRVARGQFFLRVSDDFAHLAGHRPEIAAGNIREDVEHRLNVVVIHHAGGIAAGNAGEIGQQLALVLVRASDASRHRQVHQRVYRIDEVRGRLHSDEKLNAVSRVDPIIRRHLRAAAQVHQHILGDVTLIQPLLREQGAVDVQVQRWRIERLMDKNVGRARDARDAIANLPGHGVIGVAVLAGDFDIDRRRQTEVQNL